MTWEIEIGAKNSVGIAGRALRCLRSWVLSVANIEPDFQDTLLEISIPFWLISQKEPVIIDSSRRLRSSIMANASF